jgi:hypothetical protein
MFSFIGLRTAARLVCPTLFATRPMVSRALFLSHFQTRSFLTTPRLAAAAASATSVKPKSTTRKKPAANKRVTATKQKPVKNAVAKKKPPVKKSDKSKKGVSVSHFLVYLFSHFGKCLFSDHPHLSPTSSQTAPLWIYSIYKRILRIPSKGHQP